MQCAVPFFMGLIMSNEDQITQCRAYLSTLHNLDMPLINKTARLELLATRNRMKSAKKMLWFYTAGWIIFVISRYFSYPWFSPGADESLHTIFAGIFASGVGVNIASIKEMKNYKNLLRIIRYLSNEK